MCWLVSAHLTLLGEKCYSKSKIGWWPGQIKLDQLQFFAGKMSKRPGEIRAAYREVTILNNI
jgi:hypothetical protein